MSADDAGLTAEIDAIRDRLEDNLWAWGWHPEGALDPDGDPVRAGYGHHMAQMLYRLPRDAQTNDMRRSIQSMLGDLHALLDLATPAGQTTSNEGGDPS